MNSSQNITKQDVAVGRKLMNAIGKLQGKKGISLRDLKKYLKDSKKMDVGALDGSIKLALQKALDRGILAREDGNYKLKEARRRRSRSRSKGRKTSGKRRRRRSSGSKRRRSRRKGGSRKRRSSGKRRSRRRRKAPAEAEA